jgi:hypothetical protein
MEHFEIEGRHYLAVANEGDIGHRLHQDSKIYMLQTKAECGGGGAGAEKQEL